MVAPGWHPATLKIIAAIVVFAAVFWAFYPEAKVKDTMPAKYKLTYWPLTALGEPIRWLLSYGSLDFDDIRFQVDDWPALKPTTPFGQVPILEFDGKVYWQSAAICRYLARELKLTGGSNLDALKADIVVDSITDLRTQLASYHYDANEETKAAKLGPLQKETIPFFLSRLDKIVAENGGYFVNKQLTWADIYFIAISDYMQKMAAGADFFKDYPNLAAVKTKVLALPQIQAWIAVRPADAV